MKTFNAIQLVILFAGCPFLLSWLYTEPFPFAFPAFIITAIGYVVLAIWFVVMAVYWFEEESK
jgi:hypothetical protein